MRLSFIALSFYQIEKACGHELAEGEIRSFITSRDLIAMQLGTSLLSHKSLLLLNSLASCISRDMRQPSEGNMQCFPNGFLSLRMMRLKILRWEIVLDDIVEFNHGVLMIIWRQEMRINRRRYDVRRMRLECGARNARDLQKLKKVRRWILLLETLETLTLFSPQRLILKF